MNIRWVIPTVALVGCHVSPSPPTPIDHGRVIARINSTGPFTLVLDSSSELTSVTRDVAEFLELTCDEGQLGVEPARGCERALVEIGQTRTRLPVLAVDEMPDGSKPYDGRLGHTFLQQWLVHLERNSLVLWAPHTIQHTPKTAVRIETLAPMPIVIARLTLSDGAEVDARLGLDTTSERLLRLRPELALALSAPVDAFAISDAHITQPSVDTLQPFAGSDRVDGTIGLPLAEDFDLTLDYEHMQLWLDPPTRRH